MTGATDLYKHRGNGEYLLRDYKFTSVYVSKFDLKPEWVAQVNLYTHLWRHHGFDVHRAQIVAIYRDWRRMEAERRESYPPPVQLFDVPLWSQLEAMQFLQARVRIHQEADLVPDDQLPLCTPDEQWRRGEAWAVIKKGRKTAVRVFDTPTLAHSLVESISGSYVEHRPAEPIRCKHFCQVSDFCNQTREEKHVQESAA